MKVTIPEVKIDVSFEVVRRDGEIGKGQFLATYDDAVKYESKIYQKFKDSKS